MKIKYQGHDEETAATTVAAFLEEKNVNAKTAIVEYGGEIYGAESDLAALPCSGTRCRGASSRPALHGLRH